MKPIYVETPRGMKQHGYIGGDGIFRRKLHEKDRMRIFDAWSINPKALREIINLGVTTIRYKNLDDDKIYETTVENMLENGFEKEFSGGKTRYLPLKYWEV